MSKNNKINKLLKIKVKNNEKITVKNNENWNYQLNFF
jgi:hypothetical protein